MTPSQYPFSTVLHLHLLFGLIVVIVVWVAVQVGPKEHLECHVEATNEEEPGDHEDLCDSQLGVEVECIDSLWKKLYELLRIL